MSKYSNLKLIGIATHPGHCYSAKNRGSLNRIAKQALADFKQSYTVLKDAGYDLEIMSIGSTPSIEYDIRERVITHVHPGNYVYYDAMQVALGVIGKERCALRVLVSVTSANVKRGSVAINAGTKILTRDLGGHETSVVTGYGIISGHPEATIYALSEEVGLIDLGSDKEILVGSKLEIIPNHSCTVNNQTSFLIGCRGKRVERILKVNARIGTDQRACLDERIIYGYARRSGSFL